MLITIAITVIVTLYIEAMIYFIIKYGGFKEWWHGTTTPEETNKQKNNSNSNVCYRKNCNSRCYFDSSQTKVNYEFDDHSVSPIFGKQETKTSFKSVTPALETEEKYIENETEDKTLCQTI
jgi:hypothetical protein